MVWLVGRLEPVTAWLMCFSTEVCITSSHPFSPHQAALPQYLLGFHSAGCRKLVPRHSKIRQDNIQECHPPLALQAFERRLWPEEHALRQFEYILSPEVLRKLEERHLWMDRLWVSHMSHNEAMGSGMLSKPSLGASCCLSCIEGLRAV